MLWGKLDLANAQRIQRTLESAVGAFQSGNLDGAAELCSNLLKKQPKNHHALHILGAVRLRQNDPATAVKLLTSATKRDPRNAEILSNLGAAYRLNGDATRAVSALLKAAKLDPRNASALLNLGNAALDAGEAEIATDAYRKLVALQPDHLEARKSLARLYQENNEPSLARTELEIVCERDRTDPDSFNRLGVLMAESGDHQGAIDTLRCAANLAPRDPDIRINLANVLALNFEIENAVSLYREALTSQPNDPEIACNLGNALSRAGDREAAADQYRAVISSHPNHADAHASLANNLLANGEYAEGWQHYLFRPSTRNLSDGLHRTPLPPDLADKKVGVIADQGLGDQIFFARFLPVITTRGGTTVYRPEARLSEMLKRAGIADEIASETTQLDADYLVSAGDLPFLLQDTGAETPGPYPIPAIEERIGRLRSILSEFGPPPWTGVTWRAGTANIRLALSKEVPVADLAGALKPCRGTLVVVQRNCDPDELTEFRRIVDRPIIDLSHCNDEIEDLLALSGLLDRYVGVSNTMTHLRAAAGKPSDVLVPMPAEFRWMNEGGLSPWFPDNAVFRQSHNGSWQDACNALSQKLQV